MKDPRKLKELVLEKIDFGQVLLDYDVHFVYDPTRAEEAQLRCPFHGDDRKPSARYYRETQSMFCWVCKKRWDLIEFIVDRENASFMQALKLLVKKYNVDTSSIPDSPEFTQEKVKRSSNEDFERMMYGSTELPEIGDLSNQKAEVSAIGKNIREFRGKISFKKYSALSGAYCMIMYSVSRGLDSSESIIKLKEKLKSIQE